MDNQSKAPLPDGCPAAFEDYWRDAVTKPPYTNPKAIAEHAWNAASTFAATRIAEEEERLGRWIAQATSLQKLVDCYMQEGIKQRKEIDELRTTKAAAEQKAAEAVGDARRLDWLERQYVEVRTPLRYGSREDFRCSPDLEQETSDLRKQIDAALASANGAE